MVLVLVIIPVLGALLVAQALLMLQVRDLVGAQGHRMPLERQRHMVAEVVVALLTRQEQALPVALPCMVEREVVVLVVSLRQTLLLLVAQEVQVQVLPGAVVQQVRLAEQAVVARTGHRFEEGLAAAAGVQAPQQQVVRVALVVLMVVEAAEALVGQARAALVVLVVPVSATSIPGRRAMRIQRMALLDFDNKVVNVIVYDTDGNWTPPEGMHIVQSGAFGRGDAAVNGTWDGRKFAPAPDAPPASPGVEERLKALEDRILLR